MTTPILKLFVGIYSSSVCICVCEKDLAQQITQYLDGTIKLSPYNPVCANCYDCIYVM